MEAKTLYLIIVISFSILGIIAYLTGFFRWLFGFLKKFYSSSKSTYEIPKRTIIILPKPRPKTTWWHMGSVEKQPAMQVVADYTVTNISKYNILLTVAKIKKPRMLGHVLTKDLKSDLHGRYMIPSGETTDISLDFWIVPPIKKKGETFKADVAILDQFGNHHWIKKIEFTYK